MTRFNHDLYDRMRAKYNALGAFPEVHLPPPPKKKRQGKMNRQIRENNDQNPKSVQWMAHDERHCASICESSLYGVCGPEVGYGTRCTVLR